MFWILKSCSGLLDIKARLAGGVAEDEDRSSIFYLEDDRVVQLLNDFSKLQISDKFQRQSSWIPGHKLQEVSVSDSYTFVGSTYLPGSKSGCLLTFGSSADLGSVEIGDSLERPSPIKARRKHCVLSIYVWRCGAKKGVRFVKR